MDNELDEIIRKFLNKEASLDVTQYEVACLRNDILKAGYRKDEFCGIPMTDPEVEAKLKLYGYVKAESAQGQELDEERVLEILNITDCVGTKNKNVVNWSATNKVFAKAICTAFKAGRLTKGEK